MLLGHFSMYRCMEESFFSFSLFFFRLYQCHDVKQQTRMKKCK